MWSLTHSLSNCNNCVWIANYTFQTDGDECNIPTACVCPAGTDAGSTSTSKYLSATTGERRKLISRRYCASKRELVSFDFVHHLETIADANNDGVLTEAEFNAARDGAHVMLHPGCALKQSLVDAKSLPNVGIGSSGAPCGGSVLLTKRTRPTAYQRL